MPVNPNPLSLMLLSSCSSTLTSTDGIDRLQERSLDDKIFVSVNSSSSDPLIERDSKPNGYHREIEICGWRHAR